MRVRCATLVFGLVLAPALLDAATPEEAVAVVKKTLAAAGEVVNASGTRDEKCAVFVHGEVDYIHIR